jgi:hypothetical protein
MPVGLLPHDLAPHITELNRQAAAAGRSPLAVVAMKTLPLEDRAAAAAMAREYKAAGVTHLVHTQGYTSVAQYAEVIQQIDSEVRAAL